MNNFKNIHIGSLIQQKVTENNIQTDRICGFLKCTEPEIFSMYQSNSIDSETLLKWCKLLEYDFFRLYSQHLILYAPSAWGTSSLTATKVSKLPHFRKNLYTREVIDFILEMIASGQKSKKQIMEEYRIPKTTLYKWIAKYTKQ